MKWLNTRRMEKRRGKDRGRERETVDVLYSGPSLIIHPLHHPHHITQKKQNSVLTSWWRGTEGRARREGGKLGNQMWSIKTYWHAEGLPLPHSHTESTNSYSRPIYVHVCMHMSRMHTGHTQPHTYMHSHAVHRKIHKDKYWLASKRVHNESFKMITVMPQKQKSKKSYASTYLLIFNKTSSNGPRTCNSSRLWARIWINQCWPKNVSRQVTNLQMGRHASVYGYASN